MTTLSFAEIYSEKIKVSFFYNVFVFALWLEPVKKLFLLRLLRL